MDSAVKWITIRASHGYGEPGLGKESKMLILSRRVEEGVVFDGPGRVMVVAVQNGRVILGFEADRSVTIHREEVAARINREKR